MFERLREVWLPRFFFLVTMLLAAGLAGGVFFASQVQTDAIEPRELGRVIQLFAHDTTVRKTALASAVGLVVTAFVFFRPGLLAARRARNKQPPPVVGA
jgi:hypothetical protein